MTALSDEQGGALVRSLRQEYDEQIARKPQEMPPDLLQEIMTNKFIKITEEFDADPLGDSLTYSIASDDDATIDMLKTLTLKGTHFLDLMNFFESDQESNSYVDDADEEISSSSEVIDPWTQTMDMRYMITLV